MMHFLQFGRARRGTCLLACFLMAHVLFGQKPAHKSHATGGLLPQPSTASSQPAPEASATANPAPPPPADPLGRSTPYGCVIGFLRAVDNNNLPVAAEYLDTKLPEGQAEQLASQLKAVLDASLSSGIEGLSREEQGDIRDGLRLTREKVGVAKLPSGNLDILLDRVQRGQGAAIWLFSSDTLAAIPAAYAEQHTRSFPIPVPESLKRIQLFGLPLVRWLGIAIAIGLALLLASLVTRLLMLIVRAVLHRGKSQNEGEFLNRLKQPVRVLLLSVAIWYAGTLAVSVLARHYWTRSAQILAVFGFTWLLVRCLDLAGEAATRRSLATGVQEKIAVITLVQRLLKVLAALTAGLVLLRQAGVNVSAMLAGLGIGGIALALAAQKTLEDLFGGISIITRDTIRVGDYCRVADQTGTIEDVGLGSTRLRTLDRTVVSIPNSKVAQLSSENFSLRDNFWFHHTFSVRFDTSRAQIERILADAQNILDQDSHIQAGTHRVNLIGFQGASFQIEIFAYIKVRAMDIFLARQQELLLKILASVEDAGAHLAFPSQTTYVETADPSTHAGKAEQKPV